MTLKSPYFENMEFFAAESDSNLQPICVSFCIEEIANPHLNQESAEGLSWFQEPSAIRQHENVGHMRLLLFLACVTLMC